MGDVPCVFEEPDLRFEHQGTPYGVSARRMRSLRQAPKNAVEAADQLLASGLPGVVAVKIDVLLKQSATPPGPDVTLAEASDVVNRIETLDRGIPLLTRDRDFRNFASSAGLDVLIG